MKANHFSLIQDFNRKHKIPLIEKFLASNRLVLLFFYYENFSKESDSSVYPGLKTWMNFIWCNIWRPSSISIVEPVYYRHSLFMH